MYHTTSNYFWESPDGSQLVDKYGQNFAKLLSFDRCSGEVTLIDTFTTGMTQIVSSGGLVFNSPVRDFQFSPSGRYLYGEGEGGFAQWDLEAEDIAASKVKLSGPTWALDEEQNVLVGVTGSSTAFTTGPNGKMYNLMWWSHSVIEYPDEPGTASGLCLAAENPPSCLGVPYKLYSNRHPNYRLGPLEGSGCDTLISTTGPDTSRSGYAMSIGPNPAAAEVSIEVTLPNEGINAMLEVVDVLGRVLDQEQFSGSSHTCQLDVSDWAAGVYHVVLRVGSVPRTVDKLVVTGQ
jgi:hypothetical protein